MLPFYQFHIWTTAWVSLSLTCVDHNLVPLGPYNFGISLKCRNTEVALIFSFSVEHPVFFIWGHGGWEEGFGYHSSIKVVALFWLWYTHRHLPPHCNLICWHFTPVNPAGLFTAASSDTLASPLSPSLDCLLVGSARTRTLCTTAHPFQILIFLLIGLLQRHFLNVKVNKIRDQYRTVLVSSKGIPVSGKRLLSYNVSRSTNYYNGFRRPFENTH